MPVDRSSNFKAAGLLACAFMAATAAHATEVAPYFTAYDYFGNSSKINSLEIAKANADASFDFLKAYLGAKTIADGIEVQTAYARKQFDVLSIHVKNLQDASQKAAVDIARPSHAASEKGALST